MVDISTRRRWTDEAQAREWRLLDKAPIGTIVASTDPEGQCVYVNQRFIQITGYDLDDIPTVAEWIALAYPDPDYREYVLKNWGRDVDETNMDADVHYRVRTKSGEDRQIVFRADLISPGLMLVLLRDETSEIASERDRQATEARYRELVEHSPDGIIAHDSEHIVFANPAAARIIGAKSPDDLLGREVIGFVHPDYREVVAKRMASVRRGEHVLPTEHERFVRLDGEIIDVEVAGSLVELDGRPVTQIIIRDVTDRLRILRERNLLQERLQSA